VLELVLWAQQRLELRPKSSQRRGVARVETVVLSDTSRREQPRSEHVVEIEECRRRKLHEAPTLVRSKLERLRNSEAQRADLELAADVDTEASEQARLDPHLTAIRNTRRVARKRAERIRYLHDASQRIAARDTAYVG